jgi:hypothetical protein
MMHCLSSDFFRGDELKRLTRDHAGQVRRKPRKGGRKGAFSAGFFTIFPKLDKKSRSRVRWRGGLQAGVLGPANPLLEKTCKRVAFTVFSGHLKLGPVQPYLMNLPSRLSYGWRRKEDTYQRYMSSAHAPACRRFHAAAPVAAPPRQSRPYPLSGEKPA